MMLQRQAGFEIVLNPTRKELACPSAHDLRPAMAQSRGVCRTVYGSNPVAAGRTKCGVSLLAVGLD